MDKEIAFDHTGGPLWINIVMNGLYFISYTYQLWSADPHDFPILTKPLRVGNNEIPHDDFYQVLNDFRPNDPIARYAGRVIDVRFWVKKVADDEGYNLSVIVMQGNSAGGAVVLDDFKIQSNSGNFSIKEEFITLRLI